MTLQDRRQAKQQKQITSRLHPATISYKLRVKEKFEKFVASSIKKCNEFDPTIFDFETSEGRLSVLKKFAETVIIPISYGLLKERRSSFDRIKSRKFPFHGLCWVCRLVEPTHRHHVILLKNGGSVSRRNNIVLLCEQCHSDIHPWMDRVVPVSQGQYLLAKGKNDVSYLLDSAANGKFGSFEDVECKFREILSNVFNILANNS